MGCFPCSRDQFAKKQEKPIIGNRNNYVHSDRTEFDENQPIERKNNQEKHAKDPLWGSPNKSVLVTLRGSPSRSVKEKPEEEATHSVSGSVSPKGAEKARSFSFEELAKATGNFKEANFLGQGGFGRVYKGRLEDTNEVVAIKQLDIYGCQGIREFVVEVLTLSMADHPNLVKLIGYCVAGEQRLLVYEYMPLGSLEDHLFGDLRTRKGLDWNARMKIAAGAAQGLEYLHTSMNPPVIYRDVKCSNILLGEDYHSKLSDFGLAKVGPSGDKTHVSTRVMGTYGYCAPDYAMTGQLTFKSDIYSFGVVLLEIVTGRRAIDHLKPPNERNLVDWARPMFKDRNNFKKMADPTLENHYPRRGLYQTLAICAMCLQEQPNRRPRIHDIVHALNFLASKNNENSNFQPLQSSQWSPTPQILSESDDETKA